MDSLNDALKKRMESFGVARAVSAAMILESAKRVVPENVRPKTFKNGVLTLEVTTSLQAYLLKQELDDLLEKINAALDQPVVEKLKIWITHGN